MTTNARASAAGQAGQAGQAGNSLLSELLAELGWSPRMLARRINRVFGCGTVADTAPYHWRDHGRIPRPPLPTLAAHVLGDALGRVVNVQDLWQGRAGPSPLVVPADAGFDQIEGPAAVDMLMDDWLGAGVLDRRTFLAVSGAMLTDLPGRILSVVPGTSARSDAGREPLVEQVEALVPQLQLIDDAHGGGANLAYVRAQVRAVAVTIRHGIRSDAVRVRLMRSLADLAQLTGWMAIDAGQHGLAQRYLIAAVRLAHEVDYRTMAAHATADLAVQAATRGHGTDAVHLGEAAAETAAAGPPKVRASVDSRLAYGYAVAGSLADFEQARQRALEVVHSATPASDQHEPAWMYFLTAGHLDAQAGYALIHAGALAQQADEPATSRGLLRRGQALLRTGAHSTPLDHPAQRRAQFEGAWLALAAALRGNTEEACALGRAAVARSGRVHSARANDLLRLLAGRLARARGNEHAQEFLPALRAVTSSRKSDAP